MIDYIYYIMCTFYIYIIYSVRIVTSICYRFRYGVRGIGALDRCRRSRG